MRALGWSDVPLRYIAKEWCDGPFGSGIASEHYRDEGARVIRLQNIKTLAFDGRDEAFIDEDYFRQSLFRHAVEHGDVLIAGLGDDNNLVGRACVAPEELGPALVKADCFRFRLDRAKADPRFVAYSLCASAAVAGGELAGGSTRQRINLSSMAGRKVLLPEPDEQERIANFLDQQTARLDALIAEKEQLAAALKDIEEVTAFDLVTRGLARSAESVQFTEEWLRDVPAHWALRKLRHFATVGNGSTPKRDNEEYWSGGEIPWLNSGSVNASRITEASDYVTETARKACHLPMVRAGSTVVALTGQGKTRGSASITDIATTINQHLAYVSVCDGQVADDYLWVLLTGFYSVLRYLSDGEGSTKGALTCEQLKRLRVPIPPPHEQMAIVAAYRERTEMIEALRSHASEHIDLLREYRSSLITAAVTGQLDISIYEAKAA